MKSIYILFTTIVLVKSQSATFPTTTNTDPQEQKQVASIQSSTRSAYRVRPISGTPKFSKSFAKTANELVDDYDDPIPTKIWVPTGLDFSCKGRVPGYYTDPSPLSKCQVYHMCMQDGRKYSMLCGVGTIFNQITFVCDHWYNYRCTDAENDYKRNNQLWDQFLSPIFEEEYEEPQPTPQT